MTTPKDIRWWWGVELWGKSWTPAAHHSLQWWHSVSHTASDRWSEHESQWKKKTPLTPSWRWVSAKWLDRRGSQNPHTSFINAVRSGFITQNNFPPTRSAYSKQKHCSSSSRAKSYGTNQCSTNVPFKVPMHSWWLSCWILYIHNLW